MSRQKAPQVLKIQPEVELKFKGPFNDVVTTHLLLTNPSERRVCFKVKTTAPRRYCVRPNSGFIAPGGQVDVSVMLQPLDGDAQDKTKHKFMVQSMFASEDAEDVEVLWAKASPSDMMDSKLRCVFEGESNVEAPQPQRPQTAAAAAAVVASSSPEPAASGDKNELKTLMEECKRLQAENASLKQKQSEQTQRTSTTKQAPSSDMSDEMRKQIILFAIIAFVVGVLSGYILF